ncbi:anti-sigma factor family protein [Pseudodonghicola flavimaris]|uniref:Anti-sigma factor n=1 Tax=Pseudodonghicola flavimaris TaxID=3050036 RepID=A0ABT7EXU2_9RHOB|nr:anti-sigma factor [Pseudodonghicola flavimaris]MDK3017166.1 anti-sigma factor [Pseudodonghicola flavimaris]
MPHPDTPLSEEDLLAYHHDALDARDRASMAARIATDPAAQELLALWTRQDAALATLYPPEEATALPDRLNAALAPPRPPAAVPRRTPRLALFALGALGGWGAHGLFAPRPAETDLALAALKAYDTYVVEVVHPVEVPASQRDHLENWISKRVGSRLVPPDLSASGFALMGGRVLPAADGTAGLFMYENAEGARLTLYVAPQQDTADSAFRYAGEGATQGLYWQEGRLGYAMVGQMSRDSLRALAKAAYDQML